MKWRILEPHIAAAVSFLSAVQPFFGVLHISVEMLALQQKPRDYLMVARQRRHANCGGSHPVPRIYSRLRSQSRLCRRIPRGYPNCATCAQRSFLAPRVHKNVCRIGMIRSRRTPNAVTKAQKSLPEQAKVRPEKPTEKKKEMVPSSFVCQRGRRFKVSDRSRTLVTPWRSSHFRVNPVMNGTAPSSLAQGISNKTLEFVKFLVDHRIDIGLIPET
ncbi:hypothetical protein Trydic_g1742 [Trypoxylus dichotomus]